MSNHTLAYTVLALTNGETSLRAIGLGFDRMAVSTAREAAHCAFMAFPELRQTDAVLEEK